MSALHLACKEGHLSTVKVMANCPAIDFSQVDAQDRGCLEITIENGHLAVLQLLLSLPLSRRPDIHRVAERSGSTCLHVACANRRFDIIYFLVHEKGANTLARDGSGRTPDKVVIDPIVTLLVTGKATDLNGTSLSEAAPTRHGRGDHSSVIAPAAMDSSTCTHVAVNKTATPTSQPAAQTVPAGTSKSKFKHTPYIPPTNPTFLPPQAANTTTPPVKCGPLGVTEKPVVNKLKVKDNWIKQDSDIERGTATPPSNDSLYVRDANGGKNAHSSLHIPSAPGKVSPGKAVDVYSPMLSNQTTDLPEAAASAATGDLEVKDTKKESTSDDTAQLFQWVMDDNKISSLEGALGITPNIKRDVQKIRQQEDGATLLHVACRSGHLAVAQLLVEGVGADVNAVDKSGRTSLHYAVQTSHVLLVRYLVKYCGADLEKRDTNGKTALDCVEIENSDPNSEVIARIISKAIGKSPARRTKIVLPKYSGN